jgi:hypothetical protein
LQQIQTPEIHTSPSDARMRNQMSEPSCHLLADTTIQARLNVHVQMALDCTLCFLGCTELGYVRIHLLLHILCETFIRLKVEYAVQNLHIK